jgi:enoyl-CoA hydratase/carnithine racemase
MIESAQAHALGIIDELAPQEAVVAAAVAWLKSTVALPQGPQRVSRSIARADIVQALDGFAGNQMELFLQGWYSEETQRVLQGLFPKK